MAEEERLTEEFKTVDDFLAKLYTFKESTDPTKRMEGVDLLYAVVFTILDDLPMKLIDGRGGAESPDRNPRFGDMDKILRKADPSQMRDTLSLCLLSTTLGCKDKLVERAFYLERCKRHYLKTGNKARCKRLLNGLS